MDWYEKLSNYFPVQEMKSKEHMQTLLKEKPEMYHKDESEDHVMMYVETEDFIFIDYIWVNSQTRGKGTGHKLIDKLKTREKPIILEVEPIDYDDSDTEKRLRFYKREGFQHAVSIGYRRRSLATNEINEMEILYWSPTDESEESILEKMKKTYEEIHTFKDTHFYGGSYQSVDEVLTIDEEKDDNILEFDKQNA